MAKHTERANRDADFQYIWDQKALAETISSAEQVPLNENARIAQRESQESQYLAIENTRRKAKGLEVLASLDDMFGSDEDDDEAPNSSADPDAASPHSDDDSSDEEEDALITETARILVDAINLSGPVMARADVR